MKIYRKKKNLPLLFIGAMTLLGSIAVTSYGLSIRNLPATKAVETASPSIFSIDPSFSSSMVLQRGQIIDIWGTGTPRTQFKVTFANKSINSVVGTYGGWKISFPPMAAGGPYQLIISGGASAIRH
jgi:hypothetical protein